MPLSDLTDDDLLGLHDGVHVLNDAGRDDDAIYKAHDHLAAEAARRGWDLESPPPSEETRKSFFGKLTKGLVEFLKADLGPAGTQTPTLEPPAEEDEEYVLTPEEVAFLDSLEDES